MPTSSSRLVIRANPGLRVALVLYLLFMLMWGWLAAPFAEQSSLRCALVATLTGVLAAPALLLGTTAIVVGRDGYLTLVNLWVAVTIPWEDVSHLSAEDGFQVVLRSGRKESSSAIATSLIGTIARYPSARRAIRTIEEFLGQDLSTPRAWQSGDVDTQRTFRSVAVAWAGAYALFVGCVAYLIARFIA
ncbi:hypothetical protein DQ237_03450 [Blastococcus sp. TF02-8]|uniref:hypothetical protein n=1 Tax=Blastococcus sp. TF02-8 TaxID=2250574 RepID=UPI000DE8F2AF|nr:hypothetical protein [Blastococcus sp. TF02-8]RBY97961.1 hypothetical protein DQ237_03450 [Blastococcus sp. TF02-8]